MTDGGRPNGRRVGHLVREPIVFGDLSCFVVRRVREMKLLRLTERFADFGQAAFLAFARVDSNGIAADDPYKALAIL